MEPVAKFEPDLSIYNLPNAEVRAIQAFLYKVSMKQTLTINTLMKYKDFLDIDIKIVCCEYCSDEGIEFEKCFQWNKGHHSCKLDEQINYTAEMIKSGFCGCDEFCDSEKDVHGLRLIHTLAVTDNNVPLMYFLKENSCCDFNVRTCIFGATPLCIAIQANQYKSVRYLVQVGVETKRDSTKFTTQGALERAINENRKTTMIRMLLKAKDIDVNIPDRQNRSLLLICVRHHTKYIKILLNAGADPNISDTDRQTPLLYAASNGETSTVKLLLEYGADINAKDNDGLIPLFHSVKKDAVDITSLLLEAGADPNWIEPLKGESVLITAAFHQNYDMVKLLINYGADVNQFDDRLYSALHAAALVGKTNIVKTLLDAGAVHDALARDKNTPLALAANGGHLEVMKILLPLGCNVNIADKGNNTLLHYAVCRGKEEQVELLLKYGADPDACNSANTSVLWYAVFWELTNVVKRLLVENVRLEISSRGRMLRPSLGYGYFYQTAGDGYFYQTARSPLYVAVSKRCKDTAMILINAGYNVQNETWLLKGEIPRKEWPPLPCLICSLHTLSDETLNSMTLAEEENLKLIHNLTELIHTPVRLVTLCRNTIRQYLGRNVCRKVGKLEIPRLCQDILTLKDLVGDLEMPLSDG